HERTILAFPSGRHDLLRGRVTQSFLPSPLSEEPSPLVRRVPGDDELQLLAVRVHEPQDLELEQQPSGCNPVGRDDLLDSRRWNVDRVPGDSLKSEDVVAP